VLAGVLPRLYPQMLEIAYDHQDAGRPVYIVTAAAQELAGMLAQVTAFDGGLGSNFSEVVDGHYTGKPAGAFLCESYAYSDSASDLPMLRAVGHPVVVNPDAELEQLARDSGWDVIRLDSLGRQLWAGAGVTTAAILGGVVALVLFGRERQAERERQLRAHKRRGLRRLSVRRS
jgi:phosphoserine phosphatase